MKGLFRKKMQTYSVMGIPNITEIKEAQFSKRKFYIWFIKKGKEQTRNDYETKNEKVVQQIISKIAYLRVIFRFSKHQKMENQSR